MSARYSVAESAWDTVISVAVAGVGGTVSGTKTPLGGYGTGYGGYGFYSSPTNYGSGGGGGSSVALGVSGPFKNRHVAHAYASIIVLVYLSLSYCL